MLHVISFGQSGYYESISKDLLSRIKKAYPLAICEVYNQNKLPAELINYADSYKRGYGYWRWKPFIILNHLQKMNDDDVLFYIDGRSHFNSNKIEWLDKFVFEQRYDMCAWQMHHIENHYTIQEVLNYFGLEQNSNESKSGQIAATIVTLRKRKCVVKLIEDWNRLLGEKPELFRDDFNSTQQNKNFIENRHDQSGISLLIKTSRCEILFLGDNDFNNKNAINTHFKFHDKYYSRMLNRLKMYFGLGFGLRVFNKLARIMVILKKKIMSYKK